MIEKLMMDCIMQQLHMLKKLEFDGSQSDSLRSLRYTKQSTWKWWHQKVITHASCESVLYPCCWMEFRGSMVLADARSYSLEGTYYGAGN